MPDTEVVEEVEQAEPEQEETSNEQDSTEGSEATEEQSSDQQVEISQEDYNLVLLLKNPETRAATINALLQTEGIDTRRQPSTTPEATKSLADEIKELMGDEFTHVPPKLWPAIERLLDRKIATVNQSIQENQRVQIERESQQATDKLYAKYNDVAKYEKDMQVLMGKYSPSGNQSQYEYLEDIFKLAKARRGPAPTSQAKVNARIRQNSKEVDVTSKGVDERNLKTGSKRFISAREAVELAIRGKKVD